MISACVDGKTACWASFIMMIDFDNVININFVNISTRIFRGYLAVFCDHLMLKFVIPSPPIENVLTPRPNQIYLHPPAPNPTKPI